MEPLEFALDTSTSRIQRTLSRSLRAFPDRLRRRRWSQRSVGKSIQRLRAGQCRTLDGASSHAFCAGHEFSFQRVGFFSVPEQPESQQMPLPIHTFNNCLVGYETHEPWSIAELNFKKFDYRDHKPRRRVGTLTRHSAISQRPASAQPTKTIADNCYSSL